MTNPNENEGVSFDQDGDESPIDLTDVAEGGFDVLPKGTYNVVVDEAEAKLSSKQNKMISLTLLIEDGDFEGRKLFTHVVFSPNSMGGAKRTINRLGVTELLQGPFVPNQEAADLFIGKRARAIVDIRQYEGEDRNNVKNLLAPGGATDEFLNSDE